MNLDASIMDHELDPQNMLGEIDNLPQQITQAWELGKKLSFPISEKIDSIILSGLGGSAIGSDLIASWVTPMVKIPIIVCREYNLPAWVNGKNVLVVTSSHSGNTEETLSIFEEGIKRNCTLLAITTGGDLAIKAKKAKAGLWEFKHEGQPRAAVGYSFALLLALICKLGLIPDAEAELREAVETMQTQQKAINIESALAKNPAKRLAGQLVGRYVTVLGAEHMAPVARRWKTQINELAKAWAGFEFIPEADHNMAAALHNPPELISKVMAIFLHAKTNHPRNLIRLDETRKLMMESGMNTDEYVAPGNTALANIWSAIHFGDYLAYYLAIAYQMDPTPVLALNHLKQALKDR
jgi:glucose/mannose-6-phosphate isomerase